MNGYHLITSNLTPQPSIDVHDSRNIEVAETSFDEDKHSFPQGITHTRQISRCYQTEIQELLQSDSVYKCLRYENYIIQCVSKWGLQL